MKAQETESFIRLSLSQGTDAWRTWRNGVIGASDAPVIMGENPWKSRSALLDEKLGRKAGFGGNVATRRGTRLEPEGRALYSKQKRIAMAPAVIQHKTREWQIASLDGLNPEGTRIVEIKCGEKVYDHARRLKKPLPYYVGQLQHMLSVSHHDEIDFYCYLPDRKPVLITIERDDGYIARLLEAEFEFFSLMARQAKGSKASQRVTSSGSGSRVTGNPTAQMKGLDASPTRSLKEAPSTQKVRQVTESLRPQNEGLTERETTSGHAAWVDPLLLVGAPIAGVLFGGPTAAMAMFAVAAAIVWSRSRE